jgi:hypothetical protein
MTDLQHPPSDSSFDPREEYHDDGVYLGDPNDPEDQAEAIRQIERMGPLILDPEE